MKITRAFGCPAELQDLMTAFVGEESISSIRHDVRGKLAAVRNGAFYVQRKLESQPAVVESDPRLLQFLGLIDAETAALGEMVVSRLPPADKVTPAVAELAQVTAKLLQSITFPAGVAVILPQAGNPKIRGNPGEVSLALYCLLENAVEATMGAVRRIEFKLGEQEGKIALSLIDTGLGFGEHLAHAFKPFYSTKSGRSGLGVKIARRIAERWGGKLILMNGEKGAIATLLFPPA